MIAPSSHAAQPELEWWNDGIVEYLGIPRAANWLRFALHTSPQLALFLQPPTGYRPLTTTFWLRFAQSARRTRCPQMPQPAQVWLCFAQSAAGPDRRTGPNWVRFAQSAIPAARLAGNWVRFAHLTRVPRPCGLVPAGGIGFVSRIWSCWLFVGWSSPPDLFHQWRKLGSFCIIGPVSRGPVPAVAAGNWLRFA
jgi:hypothetical protein